METKIKIVKEKIEIDANERAVNEKSQYCFFVCTTFDSFLNDQSNLRKFTKATQFSVIIDKVKEKYIMKIQI